ncbi:DDE superfamily endonuclease [Fragilaria crotonensis]|nr:DDE superfamily endonuclease [Fragilaria crotonensis]
MATATGWNDIDTSGPWERETSACAVFSSLLALCMEEDKSSVAVAVPVICLLGFRGNNRVIRTRDIPLVMSFLQFYVECDNNEFCLGHLVALMLLGLGSNMSVFRHMDMPIIPDVRVDLNRLSQSDCRAAFRFDQEEMKRTVCLLPFPDIIITHKRDRVHLLEAYAIFCRRLCYPNRWCDLHKEFGRSTSALSRIFGLMLHLIVSRVGPKVVFYPLKQERYDQYMECFVRKGADAELRIVAVIDAKKLMSCRPTHFQGSQYDRHKKGHGLKFQTLEGPDGLGISCVRAYDGRRGDGYIFRHSNLENFWRNHPIACNYRKLADSAYPTTNWTLSMFKKLPGRELTRDRQAFNATYSPMRTCVEWGYEKVVRHWAYVDFKTNENGNGANGSNVARCILAYKCCNLC